MSFRHQNITLSAPTTTVLKVGPGTLHAITINKAVVSAVIAIYDGITAADGSLIGTITLPATLLASQGTLIYDVAFAEGLTIVTSTGACDLTVSFN